MTRLGERGSAERSVPRRTLAAALLVAFVGFVALGVWQLQRMRWKHELVDRVAARVDAAPVPAPGPDRWAGLDAAHDQYRRVRLTGTYVPATTTRTQAVTALGGGSWLLTALRTPSGEFVFVNRGFVPVGAAAAAPPAGPVTVTGLLRMPEPGGGFLRRNDPESGRWYSRDVAAIAASHGLPAASTAPFFVDAEAIGAVPAQPWPRAGLTVVHFRDAHLSYALTWFAMAALTAWAGFRLRRMARAPDDDAEQEANA